MNSGYYPPMSQSQWEASPMAEIEVPEKEFGITLSQTLSKSVHVLTQDYTPEECCEPENGIYECTANTENTKWSDVYAENEFHTPLQLILLFKRHLQDELDGSGHASHNTSYIQHLISECADWCEDELAFVEE